MHHAQRLWVRALAGDESAQGRRLPCPRRAHSLSDLRKISPSSMSNRSACLVSSWISGPIEKAFRSPGQSCPAIKEASSRAVIAERCEFDSRLRALLDVEVASRIHVSLHAAGMGGVHLYRGAAEHLGKVDGEGVHGRLARITVLREGAKNARLIDNTRIVAAAQEREQPMSHDQPSQKSSF